MSRVSDAEGRLPLPVSPPQPREPLEATLPLLPLPPARPEASAGFTRPTTMHMPKTSTAHFLVHPAMFEVIRYANDRGWLAAGWTNLSIQWQELHWTADGWRTVQVLKSTDVPCPIVNGHFYLPVPGGTEIEFAVRAGIGCHAPHDTAGTRDVGELWFSNDGQNYRQVTK